MLNKKQAIICDIDDTLIVNGKPNLPLIHLLQRSANICPVLLVTYRGEHRRNDTMKEILKHGIPCAALFMRHEGIKGLTPPKVKQHLYAQYIEPKWYIGLAIEDNKQVAEMWRDNGIMTLEVGHGR